MSKTKHVKHKHYIWFDLYWQKLVKSSKMTFDWKCFNNLLHSLFRKCNFNVSTEIHYLIKQKSWHTGGCSLLYAQNCIRSDSKREIKMKTGCWPVAVIANDSNFSWVEDWPVLLCLLMNHHVYFVSLHILLMHTIWALASNVNIMSLATPTQHKQEITVWE